MKNTISRSDYLVVGGGVVGMSISRSLAMRNPTKKITLLEKEVTTGQHGSTWNSGVLHAGIYYSSGSWRAKYCVKGNKMLKEYHLEHKIPILQCGKLIVPKTKEESDRTPKYFNQGITNGVELKLIDAREALSIEPKLKVHGDFPIIWSPNTSVGTPKGYTKRLDEELRSFSNINVIVGTGYDKVISNTPENITIKDKLGNTHETAFLINCAGLYADKIAHDFGVAKHLTLLPLKGVYLVDDVKNDVYGLKTVIYPVPPAGTVKGNYFLGVHTTLTTEGKVKLGPTALPGFWRENYEGWQKFKSDEFKEILGLFLKIGFSKQVGFYLSLLLKELWKHYSPNIVEEGKSLMTIYDHIKKNSFGFNKVGKSFHYGKGGIRTQMINLNTLELLNDFEIIRSANQLHYLNIISPGWTSSLAMGEDVHNLIASKK